VSVFDHVRRAILRAGGSDVALVVRSAHRPLIECFNHIFAQGACPQGNQPHHQKLRSRTAFRWMRLVILPMRSAALELLLLDKSLLNGDNKTERCRRWEAYELAQRLRAVVEDECRPIYDKYIGVVRAAQYSDVALLFQSTSITLYEERLQERPAAVRHPWGSGYCSRQEVWDLLNLPEGIAQPRRQSPS
jgi:ATP-dependent exoDNAse (exonuclease V) beta subunit